MTVIRSWNNETTLTVVFMLKINELLADQRSVLWVTRVTSGLKMRNPTKLAGSRWRGMNQQRRMSHYQGITMVLFYNGSDGLVKGKIAQLYPGKPLASLYPGKPLASAASSARVRSRGSIGEASGILGKLMGSPGSAVKSLYRTKLLKTKVCTALYRWL